MRLFSRYFSRFCRELSRLVPGIGGVPIPFKINGTRGFGGGEVAGAEGEFEPGGEGLGEGVAESGVLGGVGQEDAALVEEAFAGAALGGTAEFARTGDDVEPDRFGEAGVRFDGMGGVGEFAFDAAGGEGGLDALMDEAVAFGRGELHPGMGAGEDKGVGDVAGVVNEAAAGVTADEEAVGGEGGGLEIAEADGGDVPFVNAEERLADFAEEGLVDGHVARRGGGAVDEEAP